MSTIIRPIGNPPRLFVDANVRERFRSLHKRVDRWTYRYDAAKDVNVLSGMATFEEGFASDVEANERAVALNEDAKKLGRLVTGKTVML
jgi:hypothetical protein